MTARAARPVLVTGAAGFIGSHLARHLAGAPGTVRAIDVRPPPAALAERGIEYHRVDVRDLDRVEELATGVDTVFHLASAHLDVTAPDRLFEEVNVRAARGLVHCCASAGVRRLVHTSSVGIYGHVSDPPATEESPKNPQNVYERTKLAGERAVAEMAAALGLDVVVLRPAWVYGPGCPRTAKLIRALRKRRFFYAGDGSNLRHPVHIDDVVTAFDLAADAPERPGVRAYIVGGPHAVTLRELVGAFADALDLPAPRRRIPRQAAKVLGRAAELAFGLIGRQPPFSRRSLAFFENDNAFDLSRARRELGFVPRIGLDEGIRRTLARTEGVPVNA